MGLILWVDENTFASGLLESIFKKRNIPLYTINSAKNFTYLVDDLNPSLMVLDSKTALASLEELKFQYESSEALRRLPVILIDVVPELNFIEKRLGLIQRPFDPFKIPEMMDKILNSN